MAHIEPAISVLADPAVCDYRQDETRQLRLEVFRDLTPGEFAGRLQEGWRRFGQVVFRPECPSCRRCQSLRVPVATFSPNESQRRAWKRNEGAVTIAIDRPRRSPAKLALYARFHEWKHAVQGWPLPEDARMPDAFVNNPFPTEEWTYYAGGTLIGVGYVDVLPDALSAIYFFWDPAEHRRSLGTYNVLKTIDAARERGLAYVYLGYFVDGCRSLEYKARFRPNEVLADGGRWVPFRL